MILKVWVSVEFKVECPISPRKISKANINFIFQVTTTLYKIVQGSAAAILKIGWKSKPDPNMIISILKYFYKSLKLVKFEALSRLARGCRALEYFVEILYENTSCFYRINVDIILSILLTQRNKNMFLHSTSKKKRTIKKYNIQGGR